MATYMIFLASGLAVFISIVEPAFAQVINGESTYEDNFLHTPPIRDATPSPHNDAAKTQPQAAQGETGEKRR